LTAQDRIAMVLTVSDRAFLALQQDESGRLAVECLEREGWRVPETEIVPDEPAAIGSVLRRWCDSGVPHLILTTGGTGLSPRDVTPEATLAVAERVVPGIAERLRAQTAAENPRSILSRGVAVVRRRTLIINLPGSPRAVQECCDVLFQVLPHAVSVLREKKNWAPDGSPGHGWR